MLSLWLHDLTRMALFEGRLFRAGAAAIVASALVLGLLPFWINFLRKMDATSDLSGHAHQSPPPIMGGLLLVVVVLVVSMMFAKPNIQVFAILAILASYAAVGALDDLAKIRSKRLIRQGKLTREQWMNKADGISARLRLVLYFVFSLMVSWAAFHFVPHLQSASVAIPFIKPSLFQLHLPGWAFVLFMSFVVTATANGANFTDGLDSLVTVPLVTSAIFTGVVAYISGNYIWSHHLLLPHLPGVDELLVVAGAMSGALMAYLWYNSPPAEIYMGDSGSIGFGGAIGMMYVFVKAELFLLVVGFVFLAEAMSVALQIGWFKWSGGKRLFRMAPLHHHFQKLMEDKYRRKTDANSKIIWRFHLVSLFMLLLGLVLFFKVR
ncbi:MAG: phospho-N-acetylmuramoyl-pentapeptide-transferase [Fibrobacterota bacterium]|nr:MAG: phospho-N-acetylmuramoyl-pentapeptide-transferase [Fibrobacterota bacterium]